MSMLVGDNDIQKILTEAYYGRPKEFDIIERELDKIRKQLQEDAKDPDSWKSVKINSSDSVNTINKIFKKVFGVKDFFVTFYTSIPMVPARFSYNAFTCPKALAVVHRDWKTGMRAEPKHLMINVQVDKVFLISDKFTTREIISLMLHEIGHNFDASIFTLLSRSLNILNPIGVILDTLGLSQLLMKVNNSIEKLIETVPGLSKLLGVISSTYTSFQSIVGSVMAPVMVMRNPKQMISRLVNPSNIFGYAGEKYSDSFATAYGYGNDISSALIKLEKREGLTIVEDVRKFPGVGLAFNFYEVMAKMITLPLDPHPDTAVRVLSQLKKMERDIEDPSLPQELKKELAAQIKEQKKLIENFTDPVKMNKYGMVYTAYWNKMIINTFDGKLDPREMLETVSRHEE